MDPISAAVAALNRLRGLDLHVAEGELFLRLWRAAQEAPEAERRPEALATRLGLTCPGCDEGPSMCVAE